MVSLFDLSQTEDQRNSAQLFSCVHDVPDVVFVNFFAVLWCSELSHAPLQSYYMASTIACKKKKFKSSSSIVKKIKHLARG